LRGVRLARCGVVVAVTLLAWVWPAPAIASFPGRNGLLAVGPVRGPGVALVSEQGISKAVLCGVGAACRGRYIARWSADGRSLALSAAAGQSGVLLMYPDGSCLACFGVGGTDAVFTRRASVLSVLRGGSVVTLGADGLQESAPVARGVSDAVWSATGKLAAVRDGWVWAGRPGALRRLLQGGSPSWSPRGTELVVGVGGWVVIVAANGKRVRRLVRGSAPVWSPDGHLIAFFTPSHRLSLIPVIGGHAHVVAGVRGDVVDWQPVPRAPAHGCVAPPRSRVMAQSATGVVTDDGVASPFGPSLQPVAYMGCRFSDGRERLLVSDTFESENEQTGVASAATQGDYAALVSFLDDFHYGGISETATVYDLRTGQAVSNLGGESIECPIGYSSDGALEGLVINAQGYTATIARSYGGCTTDIGSTPVEQLQVSDSQGERVVDTATGLQPQLAHLQLAGDTLTWQNAGQPRTTQLH
jgi:hypothetical protein